MENEQKSIIDSKYAGRDKQKDWIGQFIDGQATVPVMRDKKVKTTDESGNVTEGMETVDTGKRKLDLDRLFALAEANHVDVSQLREQTDRPNASGRLRMTVGNSLRAAARHRHGLNDLNGEWVGADAEWLAGAPRTQERDGSKIVVKDPADADA